MKGWIQESMIESIWLISKCMVIADPWSRFCGLGGSVMKLELAECQYATLGLSDARMQNEGVMVE